MPDITRSGKPQWWRAWFLPSKTQARSQGSSVGSIEPPNNCAVTSKKRLRRQRASAALRFGGLALLHSAYKYRIEKRCLHLQASIILHKCASTRRFAATFLQASTAANRWRCVKRSSRARAAWKQRILFCPMQFWTFVRPCTEYTTLRVCIRRTAWPRVHALRRPQFLTSSSVCLFFVHFCSTLHYWPLHYTTCYTTLRVRRTAWPRTPCLLFLRFLNSVCLVFFFVAMT